MITKVLTHVYNGMVTMAFVVTTIMILYHFLNKLWKLLFDKPINMSGRYVLITGCDTGFGREVAHELNRRGCHVIATCLQDESVERFEGDDNFHGTALKMDVTNMNDIIKVKETISEMVKEQGLWCVVNNAGIGEHAPIEWLTEDDMTKVFDVNLWGTINITKMMLPLVKKSKGRIVNVSSVMGRVPFAHFVSYCMSKHALEAFSDCLRHEISPWEVSVHVIESGACPTTNFYDGFQERWPVLWHQQPKHIQEEYGEQFHKKVVQHLQHFMLKMKDSIKLAPVVDAYVHAVTSSRPHRRYLIGIDAWLFTTVHMLPTLLGDMVNWMLHLHKPVMPAACRATR